MKGSIFNLVKMEGSPNINTQVLGSVCFDYREEGMFFLRRKTVKRDTLGFRPGNNKA